MGSEKWLPITEGEQAEVFYADGQYENTEAFDDDEVSLVRYSVRESGGEWERRGGSIPLPNEGFCVGFIYGLAYVGYFDPPCECDYFTPEPRK